MRKTHTVVFTFLFDDLSALALKDIQQPMSV